METYALYNEKGGVSKTTTSLQMLFYLNWMNNKKAVAIDMDPQRSLTLLSGAKPQPGHMILDALTDEINIRDTIIHTVYGDVIPTNRELRTVESQMDVDAAETEEQRKEYEENLLILRKKIKTLRGYDYVILDCPPNYANISLACLIAADTLIIPAKASKASLFALSSVSPMVEKARKYNKGLDIAGVLLTYHNDRTNAGRYGADASEALAGTNLKTKVFNSRIRYSTAVEDSFFDGVPLMERNTPVTDDYKKFFEELLKGE